ncbi:hypothetical protein K458DRAFT_462499 [Lentithecium fluviatile CBS 122367]|uniref:Uncharacterized protein n=1 Tax=Lentithecium fluviatile CBS 122367 TaxID=1168545 RepID=A0A6G1JH61_9PLEO|nr:hypothetical protein K458DRAFT_462499 [Lentithecium fluviatile CBS 122367]
MCRTPSYSASPALNARALSTRRQLEEPKARSRIGSRRSTRRRSPLSSYPTRNPISPHAYRTPAQRSAPRVGGMPLTTATRNVFVWSAGAARFVLRSHWHGSSLARPPSVRVAAGASPDTSTAPLPLDLGTCKAKTKDCLSCLSRCLCRDAGSGGAAWPPDCPLALARIK